MDVELFIAAVKDYPALYQKQKSLDTDAETKARQWIEISERFNLPVERCKKKWRNLRDTYYKHVKIKQELSSKGVFTNVVQEYKYGNSLSFLEDPKRKRRKVSQATPSLITEKKPSIIKLTGESENSVDYQEEEYLIELASEIQQNEENNENINDRFAALTDGIVDDNLQYQQPVVEAKDFVQLAQTEFMELQVSREDFQEIQNNQMIQQASDIDAFLNSLKETLMKLPPLYRAKAKRKINDIVSECEISYLESVEINYK